MLDQRTQSTPRTGYMTGFTTLQEEITCDHLPMTGTIPPWLSGSLLRNGPAQFEVGQQTYRHWFDGLAMLHRFAFKNGEVSYRNKFLQTPNYTKAKETGKISYSEFATDPCRSIFKRITSVFSPQDSSNTNVNLSKIGQSFIALTERPLAVEFDPQTLETVGVLHYDDTLAGQHCTPHPHYDPVRHMGINSITSFGPKSTYTVHAIKDDETKRTRIGAISTKAPAYIHSFGITDQYIVFVEFPLVVNPLALLLSGKPFIANFHWKPERGSRFIVMRKDDGAIIKTAQSDAFFAFHHINAFERDNEIMVDLCAFPDATIIDKLYLERVEKCDAFSQAEFRRYRLPLGRSTTASYQVIGHESIDLPRINYERSNGKDYQFAYGGSASKQNSHDFLNQLVKVDVREGSTRTWYVEGCYPGEPVFVGAPGAQDEDEGVVLSIVLNREKGNSFLLVLDAHSFEELARAEVPHHIPFGFHGIYLRQ